MCSTSLTKGIGFPACVFQCLSSKMLHTCNKGLRDPLPIPSVFPHCTNTHTSEQKWNVTYLWSEFPNPLGYGLIHHHLHSAGILLFRDGKLQVIFRQEGRTTLHHPQAPVDADEGGTGWVQVQQKQLEQQERQSLGPSAAWRVHDARACSVHRHSLFNKVRFLHFLSECQPEVQRTRPGVPTVCPSILTCSFHSDSDKEVFQATGAF